MHGRLRLVAVVLAALPVLGAWRLAGPFGGTARAITIDAQNRNILLAGSRDSLLFRSDDAGASWRLLPFPRGTPGVFNSVIIDPSESGHFYAGLDAGDSQDSGVYQSKDGGEHWSELSGLRGFRIESIAMWPHDPRVLAAGTSKGIFVSADGGDNWQRVSKETDPEMQDITALAFDPADSKTLYAGTPHLPWKTTDGGATWNSIHSGLIDDSDIFSIRVDPKQPEHLFASACSGIYRSDNAGQAWVKLQGIPGTHRRTHIIAQDPRNPDIILAGTTLGLFKSPDGGRTWRHLTSDQVNWLVFDPSDARTLYLATEFAGVLKSTDSGETFQPSNSGFVNHTLNQIAGAGNRVYVSSTYEGLHGGVFASNDGGTEWKLRANEEALHGRNLNSLAVIPARKDVLFASSEDAVWKSQDGGETWLPLAAQPRVTIGSNVQRPGRIHIYSLQAVQLDRAVLFAGTQAGLFRSVNDGMSWQRVKSAGLDGVPVLAVYAPARGGARLAARTNSGLFVSEDAGLTWRLVPLPDSSYYVYDVAIPDGDGPVLAATSRGLLQSSPAGSWQLITNGLPASTVDSVRFEPENKQVAFLAQYGKLYRSTDGGSSWSSFPSEGLEHSSIRMLWFAPDLPGRIFALSGSRGALVFDLSQAGVAREVDHAVFSKN